MNIMKSLAARSVAVKTALGRYNKAAAALSPPSPAISWESVANASVLADFDLLRGSRRQVLEQEWTKPDNRCCVEQWNRAQRAKEEIERLNVEVRRVRMLIADERCSLEPLAAQIAKENPALGWAAHRYVTRRLKVNELVANQLKMLERMPGYTGSCNTGVRLGTTDGMLSFYATISSNQLKCSMLFPNSILDKSSSYH
jgi:hypothetical protein